MNEILLDTSAYSSLMRKQPHAVAEIQRADAIAVTPVVLGELYAGFARGRNEQRNRSLLQEFLDSPRVQCLAITAATAERYAVILKDLFQAGRPIPVNDLWIAASAMEHGLVLLTCDRHFDRVRQVIVRRCDDAN